MSDGITLRDLKYLVAYIIPISTITSIYLSGFWSFLTVVITFIFIPLIELFTRQDDTNLDEADAESKSINPFFDILLYGNVLWIYGILAFLGYMLTNHTYSFYELVGLTLSTGILLGSSGINVAHELGHKAGWLAQTAAKCLLLPNLYMHFTIEHNYGHHLRVATPEDPATSRYGEVIYSFYWRTISQSWLSAWHIESARLRKINKPSFGIHNRILRYTGYQIIYLLSAYLIFSPLVAFVFFIAGVTGIFLLESINYIEHYGLVRCLMPNGKYELVQTHHSWNSDHEAGRILLYELTRHSDHHYKANKKYQLLNHYDESPQLPFGYPSSILLAMVPPLWFKIMNPKVQEWRKIHLEY